MSSVSKTKLCPDMIVTIISERNDHWTKELLSFYKTNIIIFRSFRVSKSNFLYQAARQSNAVLFPFNIFSVQKKEQIPICSVSKIPETNKY